MRYQVGTLEFDPLSGDLEVDGQHRRLAPQPAAVFRLLLERQGEMVPRGEFTAAIWPGEEFGVSERLTYCLHQLRRTLAELGLPGAIETVPRRGYRCRIAATAKSALTAPPPPDEPMEHVWDPVPPMRTSRSIKRLAIVAGIAAVIFGGVVMRGAQGPATGQATVTASTTGSTAHAQRHAARHGAQHVVP